MFLFRGKKHRPTTEASAHLSAGDELQRFQDYTWLRAKFSEALDLAKVQFFLDNLTAPELQGGRYIHIDMIGDGSHFSVYRLPAGKFHPLTLSVAKPDFLKGKVPNAIAKWAKNLKALSAAGTPLVPPLEILTATPELVAYVTLYGEGSVADVAPQWRPIEEHTEILLKTLRSRGLALSDYIQIRTTSGIPFICDFSDLIKFP